MCLLALDRCLLNSDMSMYLPFSGNEYMLAYKRWPLRHIYCILRYEDALFYYIYWAIRWGFPSLE